MIKKLALMIGEEPLHLPGIDDAAIPGLLAREKIPGEFLQFAPQPVFNRKTKSFLRPLKNLLGEEVLCDALEEIFLPPTRVAHLMWEGSDILGKDVIEERGTCLKRRQHARLIHFHQDVIRQIRSDINMLHARIKIEMARQGKVIELRAARILD